MVVAMCRNLVLVFLTFFGLLILTNGQQESSAEEDNSPFFFSCKQYDRLQNSWDQSSSKIALVEIAGNPRSYIGGNVYKVYDIMSNLFTVTVRLHEDFDSSLITGVYSASAGSPIDKPTKVTHKRKMCTILHSYAKRRPTRRVDFRWMAPPEDMGCVDFVATFTRQESILLKDERVYHICPTINELAVENVTLSGLDVKGVIFRDDFETGHFSPSLWGGSGGFQISNSCQPILHGLSATVCNRPRQVFNLNEYEYDEPSATPTHVSTVALNATNAGALQFTAGRTFCNGDESGGANFDANITLSYGRQLSSYSDGCTNWTLLQENRLPKSLEVFVILLPSSSRQPDTCFKWTVEANGPVCFGIDDVIVTNAANRPSEFHADFDPPSSADWLSLPGGYFHGSCKGSKGSALVFNAKQRGPNWASTRDLHLGTISKPDNITWNPDFDVLLPTEHWEFQHAQIDIGCETSKRHLILQPSSNNSVASVCSPSLDLSTTGNLRFDIESANQCMKQSTPVKVASSSAKLNVWIERSDHIRKKIKILSELVLYDEDRITSSLAVSPEGQAKDARICWQLLSEPLLSKANDSAPLWAVQNIILYPAVPSSVESILQFRLNMACDLPKQDANTSASEYLDRNGVHVMIQFSNDQGNNWNSLHDLCLPPTCTGALSPVIQTTWSDQEFSTHSWERITLPLPSASLTDSVRFRFMQKGLGVSSWALDDVYVQHCSNGCNGHGTCLERGLCSCDSGYQGEWCEYPTEKLPDTLRENFERDGSISKQLSRLTGHRLSAKCGQVGAGLAANFDRNGIRQLMTIDLDTTASQMMRFALRMNGPGSQLQHHCPGPDRPVESIYVHSSCNGGVTWNLLKYIEPYQAKEVTTQLIRIQLSTNDQGPSCRFKIWQAQHSGVGKDVWAVDDLYIGPFFTNKLTRNSSYSNLPLTADAFVGRHPPEEFCERNGVMVLQANELEETYPVRIEPFSAIQVELAVGCSPSTPLSNNNSVVVQYSIDGGKHWNDLDDTRRHVSLLQDWRRISLQLPPGSWSEATRFRIAQTGRPIDRSPLSIDYFFAGPDECPELCRGNGRCSLSGCVCDDGFSGEKCLPNPPLAALKASDEAATLLIGGRNYNADRDGCLVRGTRNVIFDGIGIRSIESKEIQYSAAMSILFFIRLGDCEPSKDGSYDIQIQLEVSWDGGNVWSFLREYRSPFYAQPQLEQVEISFSRSNAVPPPFKIRFVQTGIQRKDGNVWSLAGLTSSSQADVLTSRDISQMDRPLNDNADFWLVQNDADPKSSCLIFDVSCLSRIAWYGALSKEILLDVGDSIQFDIVAQRSDSAAFPDTTEQILFEYSADGGRDWNLAQPECLHVWSNCIGFRRSSRIDYRTLWSASDSDREDRFHFSTSEAMANKPILLRWLHHRFGDQQHHPLRGFQIQNVYIGPSCPLLCSGHGRCWKSVCTCDVGYSGEDCSETSGGVTKLAGFYDTFPYKESGDATPQLSSHWGRLIGGKLMPYYCDGFTDGVVFFGNRGPRSLQTSEIDTQNLRMVQFTLAVTRVSIYKQNCRHAAKRKSLIPGDIPVASLLVLDYSNDNGLTWNLLDSWPMNAETEEKRLGVSLPQLARTTATIIRWWQLTYPNPDNRDGLQWYLDDVLVNLNITNPITFEHEFGQLDEPTAEHLNHSDLDLITNGIITEWLGWQGLAYHEPLYPVDTLLKITDFDDENSLSYAETWDMEIMDPTFAQFHLILPTDSHSLNVEVRFEYSTDMGRHWNLVELECYFLHQLGHQCDYLHPPSRYLLKNNNNATRITVHLPRRSITDSTRFRWISENSHGRVSSAWGIGHVFVGGTCPWMCSGHGTCHNGHCNCDRGYGHSDCVPIDPLPQNLASHFDVEQVGASIQVFISGGSISTSCGILMSGPAAIFYHDGLRYFESTDLDMTSGSYVQVSVKFNCWAETGAGFMNSSELTHQRILFQYSVNGGITWNLIQEVKMQPNRDPQLLIIDLMKIPDLTNCTRIRMWQPVHAGEGWDTWAVDGLVVHSTIPLGTILTSNFQEPGVNSQWLTWFGGKIESFCSKDDALVFGDKLGEQQVLTGDAMITANTVLQFQVNVGCGTVDPNLEFPVRLEYSSDGGKNWHLIVSDSEYSRNPYNRMPNQTPTVYSSKTTNVWRRETVLLSHLETSRAVRFRWYQTYLNGTDGHLAPRWAIRNIVLSPQCPEMGCNGHGMCTEEGSCECDDGYHGYACETLNDFEFNPKDFHESFDGDWELGNSRWTRLIGGEHRAQSPSNVGIGGLYVLDHSWVRMLETRDLNLADANFVQFYLDFSDLLSTEEEIFVILEYSINGGIQWTTFEVIPLNPASSRLYQVPLPNRALSLATKLKWSQLGGYSGNFNSIWAIDEIYIGGEYYAKSSMEIEFGTSGTAKDNLLFMVGGAIEPSCGSSESTLHFSNHNGKSIVMTKDIKVVDQMHLQYETSTGCNHPNACNRVRLEYSDNYGLIWHSLPKECLPGEEVDCNAFQLHSELLSRATGYRRIITVPLPVEKGMIRFRWVSNDEPEYDWTLHWIYIGSSDCGDCSGRGRCWKGSCLCQSNWAGDKCEVSLIELSSSVRETFNGQWNASLWSRVNGGYVSSLCGTLDYGQALHFHEACDRYAETYELDLRNVKVIQFHLKSGCGQIHNNSQQGTVVFQFSINGGVKWQTGLSLSLNHFQDPQLVSYFIPDEAQTHAVKLRWWQLGHTSRMKQDWAIDSLIFEIPLDVSNLLEIPNQKTKEQKDLDLDYQAEQPLKSAHPNQILLHDAFRQKLWWRKINVEKVDTLCGQSSNNIMRGRSNSAEESILETSDFVVASTKGSVLSFDILVGDCGYGSDYVELVATPVKFPVRFEVSYDHGISWKLFNPLIVRGQKGHGPQIPSVYSKLDKWQSYQYSLEFLSGSRYARFRWRHPKSSSVVSWAVNNFDIGPLGVSDPQFIGLETLSDDFNDGLIKSQNWRFFSGGKITVPNEKLGDGAVGMFQGPGQKILQTVALDLTFGQNVQFVIHFQLSKGRREIDDSGQNVFLQCSPDKGFKWILIEDYVSYHYATPSLVHAAIPEECRNAHSLLRWWQPADPELGFENVKKSPAWLIDNIVIEHSHEQLFEIYDSFSDGSYNQTQWHFHPNGFISNNFCGIFDAESSLNFISTENSRFVGITSKHVTIRDDYAAHFKIKTSCGTTHCHSNGNRSQIRFEMRQGYDQPLWALAKPNCLPSSSTHSLCEPQIYHSSSSYMFGTFSTWHRVIIPLKSLPFANAWQFRWMTQRGKGEKNIWAIKDVYIGQMCPFHCHGHGDCIFGKCLCDIGYEGLSCSSSKAILSTNLPIMDHFDDPSNSSLSLWESINGGSIKAACGSLIPLAHGKHLHFDGCDTRMATTVLMDVSRVRRVTFVIRIGTPQQIPSCRIQPIKTYGSEVLDRAVLLQYSYNGVDWLLLASHGIRNFVQPQRMVYNIPFQTNSSIVQLRWWQPLHGGSSWDQWALDNVEILI